MIPKNENIEVEIITYPSNTYKLDTINKDIRGYVDGLESVKQAIYKILNTDRYEYMIYSWNYGFEISDLIGKPHHYIILELEDRIREALMQDDRILGVNNFVFEKEKDILSVYFEINTIFGNANAIYNLEV